MTATKPWPTHWLTVLEDEVVLLGDAGGDVFSNDLEWPEALTDEQKEEFLSLFDPVTEDRYTQGNSKEDYYQGMTFVHVWRRKSDGKLFGAFYWQPVAKYYDIEREPNGYEHGYEFPDELTNAPDFDWDEDYVSAWVLVPVKPYTITGYEPVNADD